MRRMWRRWHRWCGQVVGAVSAATLTYEADQDVGEPVVYAARETSRALGSP